MGSEVCDKHSSSSCPRLSLAVASHPPSLLHRGMHVPCLLSAQGEGWGSVADHHVVRGLGLQTENWACQRLAHRLTLSHQADPRVPKHGPFCRLPRQHLLQPFSAVEVARKVSSSQASP